MNIQDLFNEALQDTQAGRYKPAEKKLLKLAREPLSDEGIGNVHKLLGMVRASTGQFAKAADAFRVSCEKLPSDPSVQANLCGCLMQGGQLAEAVAAGKAAVERHPGYADAHLNLADAYRRAGDLPDAANHYRKAIEISPGIPTPYNNLGNTLRDLGDLEGAVANYKQALGLTPDNANVHNNLGLAHRSAGEFDAARSCFLRAIELRPEIALYHSNLGMAYRDEEDTDNALSSFGKALELDPGLTRALVQRGHIHRDNGEFAEAIKDYDRADTGVARAELLRCLYAAGRYNELFEHAADPDRFATNVGAAALCAFAAEQLGRDNPHPFCPNPLDFLYYSELDTHIQDRGQFIEALIADIRALPSVWDPISTTTKSGFQTRGNLFDQKPDSIRSLKQIIEREILAYRDRFADRDCLLIKSWPAETGFNAWSVRLQTDGHQNAHIHASGWLSGVVYLQLVPSDNKDEGAIVFGSDGYGYPPLIENVAEVLHRPSVGDIVLFPSSLFHRTVPITREGERIIVAFDLVPKQKSE